MENFEIRTYGRTELALCYFPDLAISDINKKFLMFLICFIVN